MLPLHILHHCQGRPHKTFICPIFLSLKLYRPLYPQATPFSIQAKISQAKNLASDRSLNNPEPITGLVYFIFY